jgi:predicted lipoprotein with Yx(FWY)xxD motif
MLEDKRMKYGKWLLFVFVMLLLVVPTLAQDATPEAGATTVSMSSNDELGSFLVGPNGMTLYIFTNDEPGLSNCSGDCAANWPPLTVAEDENPTAAAGIPGVVATTQREDGTFQVTYNGWPLYYFAQDAAVGDTTGHGVGDVWWLSAPPTVGMGWNDDLGNVLVGPNGMTLYTFSNDEAGVSNCSGDCAANWPPLTIGEGQELTAQPGLVGEWATIERDDGSQQVTYNGMPLYYFANDAAIGDATGQARGDVWWVIQPTTLSVGSSDELGDYLIGPNGMTLYLYTKDEANVSNCYDRCAIAWPPLFVGANQEVTAGEGVDASKIGMTERTDGTRMVTYDGKPLYYWVKDVKPGDTTGQNVGEVWFVLEP